MISTKDKERLIEILKKSFKKYKNYSNGCSSCPISLINTKGIWEEIGCQDGCYNRIPFVFGVKDYSDEISRCEKRVNKMRKLIQPIQLMETE